MKLLFFFMLSMAFFSVGYAYEKPENISQELWDSIAPYFLPEDHPLKPKMDKIFGKKTVTKNSKTVNRAGFYNSEPGKYSKVIVSKHPSLKGFVVKMYLDSNNQVNDGEKFRERIWGAEKIKSAMEAHSFGDVLKVPQKWIYPIQIFSDSGLFPKQFVLVAEDMYPYSYDKSLKMWKYKTTKRQLKAVFVILTTVGLPDCSYAFNIPFCKDGKLAFLDTEQWGLWPVHYQRMHRYLKGDRLTYWISLREQL